MMDLKKNNQPYLVALVVTLAILAALAVFFVRDYQRVRHSHQPFARSFRGQTLTANDASSTQVWMTFDYVNHLFALPPQYLSANLSLTDSRYPRLTISTYAREAKISSATALFNVQNSIRAYFSTSQ
jgi:hypothetical protein